MFEPQRVAELKMSFKRDGLDVSKARHISATGDVRGRTAGKGRVPSSGKTVEL
jgi:hypothetical protein